MRLHDVDARRPPIAICCADHHDKVKRLELRSMGEGLWKQKTIRSLLILLAITVNSVAKPLSPCCVPPDTGSGAGYCATQLKMMTPPPIVLEEQLSAQLRQLFPEGGKDSDKDGSLHAAMLEQLEKLLRFRSHTEALLRKRDDERKAIIELIRLPVMQKVRQGKAVHKFQKWQQAIIMYQQSFGITDIETAEILRQQLKRASTRLYMSNVAS